MIPRIGSRYLQYLNTSTFTAPFEDQSFYVYEPMNDWFLPLELGALSCCIQPKLMIRISEEQLNETYEAPIQLRTSQKE
jgi:hypothetical protein